MGSVDLFFSPLPLATSSPCCQLVFLELLRGRHAELPPAEYGDSFNCGEILAVVAEAAPVVALCGGLLILHHFQRFWEFSICGQMRLRRGVKIIKAKLFKLFLFKNKLFCMQPIRACQGTLCRSPWQHFGSSTDIWSTFESARQLSSMATPMRSSRAKASPILTSLVCGFLLFPGGNHGEPAVGRWSSHGKGIS